MPEFINGVEQDETGPILGGSGAVYPSFAAAIAGETETAVTGTVVASTIQGRFDGSAGFSAVDDFYNGQYVVLQASPTDNGITNVWAQIVDYIGATRTFIIDRAVQFPLSAIAVVNPIRLTLRKAFGEPGGIVTVNKSAIINLGGNQLTGRVVVSSTGGTPRFVWMKDGDITQGVRDENTGFCAVLVHNMTLHRREADFYAYLRTNASNFGRFEFINVNVRGLVASRCGFLFASVKGGTYQRVADVGIVQDSNPGGTFRFVEAAGVAITYSNVAVDISAPLSGCIFFTESAGSIASGAPNYLSVNAVILSSPEFTDSNAGPASYVDDFAIACARGSGALTVTVATGTVNVGVQSARGTTLSRYHCSVLKADNATTSAKSVTFTSPVDVFFKMDQTTTDFFVIAVTGGNGSTASLTVTGTGEKKVVANGGIVSMVLLDSNYDTGTISVTGSGGWSVFGAGQAGALAIFASDVGPNASTITISEQIAFEDCGFVFAFGFSTAASTFVGGTVTLSSRVLVDGAKILQRQIPAAVTGGTWTISGSWLTSLDAGGAGVTGGVAGPILVVTGANSAPLIACSHSGTTATLTCSGSFLSRGGFHLSFRHCHKLTGGSGTCTMSGFASLMNIEFENTFGFVFSDTAGGTAVGSGGIFCNNIWFDETAGGTQIAVVNAVAGANATGPEFVEFEFCRFENGFITQTGAGTITWAAGTIPFFMTHCSMLGAFTIVGTPFSFFEVFESDFYGAVTDSGTRPANRYAWFKCDFNVQFLSTTLRADVLDDFISINNDGNAKGQGELCEIDATPQAATPNAASDTIEGVLFEAAGANNNSVTLVRRGIMNVRVEPNVAIGDNLIAGDNVAAAYTEAYTAVSGTGVGRRIGRALTAHGGGGGVERAYAAINLM